MCGGTRANWLALLLTPGLSPRVRGNLGFAPELQIELRSIPACAGEPRPIVRWAWSTRVYPRVCGGTRNGTAQRRQWRGLSPRVRGNLPAHPLRILHPGSIPACAGEPLPPYSRLLPAKVYPRVCGGTRSRPALPLHIRGLSPRVRGNPPVASASVAMARSIPACAGEPGRVGTPRRPLKVYPRVCGGTHQRTPAPPPPRGLSPRVRGNLAQGMAVRVAPGSIPACAGEPPAKRNDHRPGQVYPRVCGGTEDGIIMPSMLAGLSPRVRGNPYTRGAARCWRRSIPACAGEPVAPGRHPALPGVYPRVCGGTYLGRGIYTLCGGLSPRVRGNRDGRSYHQPGEGSIPACAGEPGA